ncbi:MAG: hypothetical protein ABIZ72_09435 [Candidatus Limnocylindrales bacterium]
MRATSKRRLAGAAAALTLTGATLLTAAGSALGADTRKLYVGPDPNFALATNGTLAFTGVTSGGSSLTTIYVKNIDNQNLTHVVLTFERSQGTVSIQGTVLGPNAASCSAAPTLITCDFGNLKASATRSFSLILDAPSAGTILIHGTVVFNESTNPNGGNTQINAVDGSLAVAATSCNALATFLPPGIAKTLAPSDGTACATDHQRSSLVVPANPNGSLVTLDDQTPAVAGTCGAYVCFGNEVNASVNAGATVTPYLTWTITYSALALGNINLKQVGFQHDGTIILAGRKGTCGATFTNDCIVGYVVNPDGSVTWTLRTRTNSVMKGLH